MCPEYPPGAHGGIGTFTQVMARALVRSGHAVRVVGVYPNTWSGSEREDDGGVAVWRIVEPRIRGAWLLGRIQLYRLVSRWSRTGEIDLVEVPDYQGWAAGWPSLPVPVVARLHGSSVYLGSELSQRRNRATGWLERVSLRRVNAWCATSRYTAARSRELFKMDEADIAVLYNPVDPLPVPDEGARQPGTVLFAGTLSAMKGVVSLINAWPQVKSACGTAQLHFYGKDTLVEGGQSMQAYLSSRLPADLRSSVVFHGHVARNQLLDALCRTRVAVFPSFVESFANAPLEAMACGCPTVYTRRCSGPEVISDGVHGLLVEPDDPRAIADAITRLLEDRSLGIRLGEAGRERVRRQFASNAVVGENESFYESCIRAFCRTRKGASDDL